jgi:hypothetical protein
MSWAVLIPIILQYGLPFAEKLFALATTNNPPTQADWDALKVLADQTPETQMQAALTRAGIPLDSPQAVALLALIPKPPVP